MMGVTHIVISTSAVSLVMQTADAKLILVGGIASLLPDVDTSTSIAGRVFPWVSSWLERRFPHRSCSHSLMASLVVAAFSYPAAIAGYAPLELITALNIGFFFGYFADVFTASGCEMFWPMTVRAVWPGNRNFRLRMGSPVEYGILIILVFLLVSSININANGGIVTQFNRLIASPVGVEQIYNSQGSNHLMVAHLKGVRVSDRAPVRGDFWIIQGHGQGFIVQGENGAIYKVGNEPDVQVIAEHLTADTGPVATISVEPLKLNDQEVLAALAPFNRPGFMVFVSGQMTIDDPESLTETLFVDGHQFPFIRAAGASVTLEAAPLAIVQQALSEQFAIGQLFVRTIYAQPQASPNLGSKS